MAGRSPALWPTYNHSAVCSKEANARIIGGSPPKKECPNPIAVHRAGRGRSLRSSISNQKKRGGDSALSFSFPFVSFSSSSLHAVTASLAFLSLCSAVDTPSVWSWLESVYSEVTNRRALDVPSTERLIPGEKAAGRVTAEDHRGLQNTLTLTRVSSVPACGAMTEKGFAAAECWTARWPPKSSLSRLPPL